MSLATPNDPVSSAFRSWLMNYKSFADAMRHGLNDAKSRGVVIVSIDDVLKHVSDLQNAIAEQSQDTEKSVEEVNQRSWEKYLEDYRAYLSARNDIELKMFESVISTGQNAIRILLTMNGGAAIAVLAFLGHLASINSSMLTAFATPLKWFTIGVALVGAVAAVTYLTQVVFSSTRKWLHWIGFGLQVATILCGMASIVVFIFGLIEMSTLFNNFDVNSE